MRHPTTICVAEEISGVMKSPAMVRSTMLVHNEHPAEAGFAEFRGQVHEDRAKRARVNVIGSGKHLFEANLIETAHAKRKSREHDDDPSRSRDDRLGDAACNVLV